MLNQIVNSLFSKLTKKLVDYEFDTFLDRMNVESTSETLKNRLSSLSDKAFDVEGKIKSAELSGKKKRKREVEEWLKQVKMIKNECRTLESEVQAQGFLRKFLNGYQPTQLNAKVRELVEQSRCFGELLVDVYEVRGEELLTTNLSGKGFKVNLKRIWNFLKSDRVSSIGIYGMGGVGKTALAKHINNIILEKRKEKRVCWITVSEEFSIKKLQDEIARFIGLDLSDECNVDKRAARLHRAIGNNFILILDDVWEYICLEKLGDPLRLDGCRLILVTRLDTVCCQMGCQEKVKVEKLHMDEAWNLFKQKLGQDIALYPDVEKIAKQMAKVCDGLPLGIIVLAGSMKGETSTHVWRNELEKLKDPNMVPDEKDDKVNKVLRYSFDRLHLNLQLCFLHCSLYPEDFQIDKKELVERFILEELVDKRKSRQSQHDHGHAMLNKLVNVWLLEPADENCVKMHDLVRAMALKITKQKNMVISGSYSLKEIPNTEKWVKDLEKVSLMNNGIMEIPDGVSPHCPNLTTLILHWNPLKSIADSFFTQLDSLCFLDLSHTNIKKLPNSLSNLENLKALNLGSCKNLEDIPYLGKLKKLEELVLSDTSIKKVPPGIEELVNLRRLSLNAAKFLYIIPEGLFLKFPYLQCLHLPYQIKAPMEEIARLKCLEEFLGRVKTVSDFNEFVRSRPVQLTVFYIIMVYGGVHEDFKQFFIGKHNRKSKLNVRQCDLKNGEDEGSILSVRGIQFLKLEECEGLSNSFLDDFPRLDNPSSLEVLEIYKCRGIECILPYEQFFMANQESPLRDLREIVLSELQNFAGLIQNIGASVASPLPQNAVFSSLRSLSIFKCNKMRKLGLPLSEFQNLEEIFIENCDDIEELIEAREGEGEGEGERRVVSLPKLKELFLYDLPRLKSICNTTMFCGSVKRIQLIRCRELKKLPLYFDPTSYSPPQTLKQILIGDGDKEWWESLEWEYPTHIHLLQPLVRSVGC